jgi:formylglycine-generating enzyme required for sulfatase activity
MGSDPKRDENAKEDEQPQHTVTLPAFDITSFPVTVAEFACFVRAGQNEPGGWYTQMFKLDHPVVWVTWHDAEDYAAWLAGCTGGNWRLPTEAEWEKAARGTDGRIYPWGDAFDRERCNTDEAGIHGTAPVGSYPSGASSYGVQDMAGNVWDWTSSWKSSYPYTASGVPEVENSALNRVQRGGAYFTGGPYGARFARAACLHFCSRFDVFRDTVGFRLVRTPPAQQSL